MVTRVGHVLIIRPLPLRRRLAAQFGRPKAWLATVAVVVVLGPAIAWASGAFTWGVCTERDVARGLCNTAGRTAHWAPREGQLFARWLSSRGASPARWAKSHPDAAATFLVPVTEPPDVRMVADLLEDVLLAVDSPMAPHSRGIARAAKREDANPFALAGIAGLESAWGRIRCGGRWNAWGIGACGRAWRTTGCVGGGAFSLSSFDPPYPMTEREGWRRAFRAAARFIRCRWPGATTIWHLHGYCACGGWFERVMANTARFGSGPGLRWRDAVAAVRTTAAASDARREER